MNTIGALCENDNAITLTGTPAGGAFSGSVVTANGVFDPALSGAGTFTIQYDFPTDPCIVSANANVIVNPLPANVSAGPSISIVLGGGANLQGSASGTALTWSPSLGLSNTNTLTPFANPQQTTTYTLAAENSFGCIATDTMVVYVNAPCLDPSKIFTPNNDGLYDKWIVFNGSCLSRVDASVYNRYGSLVYHANDYQNQWDGTYKGKPLPDATYYYVLNITDINGNKYTKKGNVTIMR